MAATCALLFGGRRAQRMQLRRSGSVQHGADYLLNRCSEAGGNQLLYELADCRYERPQSGFRQRDARPYHTTTRSRRPPGSRASVGREESPGFTGQRAG